MAAGAAARRGAAAAVVAGRRPPRRARAAPRAAATLPGVAEAAAVAVTEVAKAVRMRGVEAPDAELSYVALDQDEDRVGKVDENGLPLVYDGKAIQAYWAAEGGALKERWGEFVRLSVPFLTRVVALGIRGGAGELEANGASLARDARKIMEKLGPTYIKAGQMMSVRPDVLPQVALDELAILQDSVKPFDTTIAIETIESELGRPLGAVFSEISEQPVAAASLAQVYKAKLVDSGEWVAVKVQRPAILELVSKDLYVLRRAAEVYQGLVERFAPQQRTDYVGLLNEWAVGFYSELDFVNEANNQQRLKSLLAEEGKEGVYIPEVYREHCTRRLLVSEWVDGVKLSECEPDEIRELIAVGQESFLTQLLSVGFFHSDPHPGNILRMDDQSRGRIALLDFGLMARIRQEDMDTFVSSIVHLANKDYAALVDDFIALGILPEDCDRAKVEPLMDKALSPYVKGGGAKNYEEELKRLYGMDGSVSSTASGFQAMTQDMLTVLNDIPFSIPPYFALLARAVVTLEGVALTGDPGYRLVMESYPFVARKLLREDRPEVQRALQEVLYGGAAGAAAGDALRGQRLSVLLNSAMGVVAETGDAFVDFDSVPEEGVKLREALGYLLSPEAESLRGLLEDEAVTAADLLGRQASRRAFNRAVNALPTLPFLPRADQLPLPLPLPPRDSDVGSSNPAPQLALVAPAAALEALAPPPSREEELYALSLVDLARVALGPEVAAVLAGDALDDPAAVAKLLLGAVAAGGNEAGVDQAGDSDASVVVPPQVAALAAQLRDLLAPAQSETSEAEALVARDSAQGEENAAEILGAVRDLGEAERQVLSDAASRVLTRVLAILAERAAPLAA